eukprot:CCRYP_006765-RA/>CCRYP_006765-RA protein AED:0.44 eAED:0.44 QI:0/0/0/1/0/0/3/0/237
MQRQIQSDKVDLLPEKNLLREDDCTSRRKGPVSWDASRFHRGMIDMSKYVEGILEEFPEPIQRSSPTPYSDGLFTIKDEGSSRLPCEGKAMQIHRITAQLLFLCMRAQKDIQTAVSFLTTRSTAVPPRDKINVVRIQGDDLHVMRWYMDAAHVVHWDCKGQTGAAMTMGQGAILSYSWMQKLNTKSLTETELVGVDDVISNILLSLYFLQEQGCGTTHAIIYQTTRAQSSSNQMENF